MALVLVSAMAPSVGSELVSFLTHLALLQKLQTMIDHYMELSVSYDVVLGTRRSSEPMTVYEVPSFLLREFRMEIVHQIAMLMFGGLQLDIQQFPSTSSQLCHKEYRFI